jgi:hypothetical protein
MPGFGLSVRDVEARAADVVEANVADSQIAEFAVTHAAVAEHPNDERAARVGTPRDRHPARVPVDGRLAAAEFLGDRVLAHSAREELRDLARRFTAAREWLDRCRRWILRRGRLDEGK